MIKRPAANKLATALSIPAPSTPVAIDRVTTLAEIPDDGIRELFSSLCTVYLSLSAEKKLAENRRVTLMQEQIKPTAELYGYSKITDDAFTLYRVKGKAGAKKISERKLLELGVKPEVIALATEYGKQGESYYVVRGKDDEGED